MSAVSTMSAGSTVPGATAESLPSTRTGVDRLASLVVAGLRLGTLAQMLPSLTEAIRTSPRPTLCLLTWVVAIAALVGTAVVSVVRRRPPGLRLVVPDVVVAVALLAVGTTTVPVPQRTGTWIGFESAYVLAVACSMLGLRDRLRWVVLLAVLVLAEAVYLAPVWSRPSGIPTVLGNLLTMVVIAPLVWHGIGWCYRLAAQADEARAQAARLAREEEERRARAAIHNGAAIMRMLVAHDESGSGGEAMRTRLLAQAEIEVNRMRAYLRGAHTRAGRADSSLGDIVHGVAEEFADLPIEVVEGATEGRPVAPELAHDLAAALRSLLLNVRQHAGADHVVLHVAECADRGWTVTVHDDGVGFDAERTRLGVGLQDLVVRQLQDHGITTDLSSAPGGTTVTLTGCAER